jgi:hypothetical protein
VIATPKVIQLIPYLSPAKKDYYSFSISARVAASYWYLYLDFPDIARVKALVVLEPDKLSCTANSSLHYGNQNQKRLTTTTAES